MALAKSTKQLEKLAQRLAKLNEGEMGDLGSMMPPETLLRLQNVLRKKKELRGL